ncbi:arabinose metabolism transcriptional repressor [Alicyclobacillus contaminans]|uniref:GntR family transcriptional regulator n=1 Tax=Alicyclobacillus contaminans TaxID=392016 RepID=UPI000417571B|nr:GntR family transcriptional regulator [Alicyclobacillus contaminans]GMA50905.1 arabinose metabolism transcriptional repressor [Alicyclobacillus contaminans]
MSGMRLREDGTKYQQVKNSIKNWILSGQIGEDGRIPSENQIAEGFGISRHTVRQAIGELVNEGWLYREQGRGTFAKRSGDMGSSSTRGAVQHARIAVITTYLADYIFPFIISGIESHLSAHGHTLSLFSTGNNVQTERRALETVLAQAVDGLIVEPTKSTHPNPNIDLYLLMEQRNIPFVMLHSSYVELNASMVSLDDAEGAYLATKHLLDLGHTWVAGLFKSDDLQGRARFKGFVKAHHNARVPIQGQYVKTFTTEDRDSAIDAFVDQYFKQLADAPTAVVCYNDEVAIRLIQALNAEGMDVPGDVSVTGFDDSTLAVNGSVPLTTIRHPKAEMGEAAARMLLDMMNQPENMWIPREHVFQPELIVRQSTTVPR